jgi:hypothetical protein
MKYTCSTYVYYIHINTHTVYRYTTTRYFLDREGSVSSICMFADMFLIKYFTYTIDPCFWRYYVFLCVEPGGPWTEDLRGEDERTGHI